MDLNGYVPLCHIACMGGQMKNPHFHLGADGRPRMTEGPLGASGIPLGPMLTRLRTIAGSRENALPYVTFSGTPAKPFASVCLVEYGFAPDPTDGINGQHIHTPQGEPHSVSLH